MKDKWKEAQKWEKKWHGDCSNSFNEEFKQYIYASKMSLNCYATNWYGRRGWDFGNKTIIDIGGGPCSILLKSKANLRTVIDPCEFPDWVKHRYEECGIVYLAIPAENMPTITLYDVSLCYNVLQHVDNPKKIIKNMRKYSKEIHLFEWIDTGVGAGHLYNLQKGELDEWLGGYGKVEQLVDSPAVGKAYYGVFIGGQNE